MAIVVVTDGEKEDKVFFLSFGGNWRERDRGDQTGPRQNEESHVPNT